MDTHIDVYMVQYHLFTQLINSLYKTTNEQVSFGTLNFMYITIPCAAKHNRLSSFMCLYVYM